MVQRMSLIANRRSEEKERRRAEILDAAETLYAAKGWDAVTVDKVARSARLSRALVYVYFRDKEELLFGIGERAMRLLRERFLAATIAHVTGMDQIDAIGRAYMRYAHEFPHYFDFWTRFQAHSVGVDPGHNEGNCQLAGDQVIGAVVGVIETGLRDGSIRSDMDNPKMLAVMLWGFIHGIIQLAMAKGSELARLGVAICELGNCASAFIRAGAQCPRLAGRQ
jgi:AcrR family transcriptional regulator